MARSKKLSRQIARYLGSETAEQDIAALIADLRAGGGAAAHAAALSALDNLAAFLDIVDASYQKYEENLAVAERNVTLSSEELVQANRSISSMVNSLGQGFLMFDATGICGSIYSKACQNLLETVPAGKPIAAVLRLDAERTARLATLLQLAFDESHAMSFDEVMGFAPSSYRHSQGAHIRLDYKPDRAADGRLEQIVVVATDITEQVRAQELAEERRVLFESIERVLRDRASFGALIRRISELADMLVGEASDGPQWENLQRETHTLKGGAGLFRLTALSLRLHDLETAIKPLAAAGQSPDAQFFAAQRSILLRELEATVARFRDLLGIDVRQLESESSFDRHTLRIFADHLGRLGLADVRRDYIRAICAEPLADYMRRYDLVLGDLAARLNKNIHPIRFIGANIPVLIDPYRDFLESLVHLFRNLIDHGIETPDIRQEVGKDEAGLVTVSMALFGKGEETWLRLGIEDDGAGVDIDRLRAKLADAAPAAGWAARGEEDVLSGLLTGNVSTRDAASLYSGRGIGVGAVYAEVVKLGGAMSIRSAPAKGTAFTIEIPYRLDWA